MKKSMMTLDLLLPPYIRENREKGNLNKETITCFEVKEPKFARFYLLFTIHHD